MKMVYIAGPYGDSSGYLAIDENITRARNAAIKLAIHGIGYSCPHLNSAHFEVIAPDVPISFWRELDLRLLQACDAILMLPGWISSDGSKAELEEAKKLGLKVFYFYSEDLTELITWSKE